MESVVVVVAKVSVVLVVKKSRWSRLALALIKRNIT